MTTANSRGASSTPPASKVGQSTFDLGLRMGGLALAILLVALFLFIVKPHSFNIDVGISVLRAMSSVAIMSLGLTLVIVVGEIDLSFGAMYGLGANSLAVMWIVYGVPVYIALPLTIVVGALVGLFNGALVTALRIPSFIVTLGSYNLIYGVSLWITKTSTFNPVYPPPGVGHTLRSARFLHQPDRQLRQPSDFARSRLDDRARDRRRLPPASHPVRLPVDGDRRQPDRGRGSRAFR